MAKINTQAYLTTYGSGILTMKANSMDASQVKKRFS